MLYQFQNMGLSKGLAPSFASVWSSMELVKLNVEGGEGRRPREDGSWMAGIDLCPRPSPLLRREWELNRTESEGMGV